MKSRMKNILLAGALVFGAQLSAQETTRWDAGGGLILGLDGARSVTGNSQGFNVQAGFNANLSGFDAPYRVSLQVSTLPWNGNDPANTGLRNVQLAGDIFTQSPFAKLRLVTGLSLNKWTRGEMKTAVKGLKFGLRAGLDYALAKHWSAETILQIVELGSDAYETKGLNPSWIQFGVRYHF